MLDTVVDTAGTAQAYDLAWCLAAAAVGEVAPWSSWSLEFPDIDDAAYETRWVARFLSAYANADADTADALWCTATVDGRLSECLMTLAGSAAATIRRRLTS